MPGLISAAAAATLPLPPAAPLCWRELEAAAAFLFFCLPLAFFASASSSAFCFIGSRKILVFGKGFDADAFTVLLRDFAALPVAPLLLSATAALFLELDAAPTDRFGPVGVRGGRLCVSRPVDARGGLGLVAPPLPRPRSTAACFCFRAAAGPAAAAAAGEFLRASRKSTASMVSAASTRPPPVPEPFFRDDGVAPGFFFADRGGVLVAAEEDALAAAAGLVASSRSYAFRWLKNRTTVLGRAAVPPAPAACLASVKKSNRGLPAFFSATTDSKASPY